MTQPWLQRGEPSGRTFIRACSILGRRLGWRAGRALVFPISLYFTLRLKHARAASRAYLSMVLGRNVTPWDVFRHIHTFSCTIHDRIRLLTGRIDEYEVTLHGADLLHDLHDEKRGCLLLGSHLGSFEVLRALGLTRRRLPIKVMMYAETTPEFYAEQNHLNPEIAESIIPIGSPGSMLRVKEFVDAGGMVGILGDRTVENERSIEMNFLGRPTRLPVGPLTLANALGVPVVLFFGLYRGGRRYDVYLELLAERITIDRSAREQDLERWLARYAERLEHYCREAPYNWFNFFDFWQTSPRAG